MRPKPTTEMVLLSLSTLAASLAAVFGAIQGMFNAGVMYFDTGYQPNFWQLVIPAFINGFCCSLCSTIPCLGTVAFLLLLGFQFDLVGRGFWKVFLGIWGVGFLNGAVFAALMIAILQRWLDSVSDTIFISLAIVAGLATLLIDGTIIVVRYRYLKPYTQITS